MLHILYPELIIILFLALLISCSKPSENTGDPEIIILFDVPQEKEVFQNEENSSDTAEQGYDIGTYPKTCPPIKSDTGVAYTCESICAKINSCEHTSADDCPDNCKKFIKTAEASIANTFGKCVIDASCDPPPSDGFYKMCMEVVFIQYKPLTNKERLETCKKIRQKFEVCETIPWPTNLQNDCEYMAMIFHDTPWNFYSQCSGKECESFLECLSVEDCFLP
jgi:hypothetical protein